MTTFRDMKIGEQIIAALDENGFEEAFPIQQAAIPVLLTGNDRTFIRTVCHFSNFCFLHCLINAYNLN